MNMSSEALQEVLGALTEYGRSGVLTYDSDTPEYDYDTNIVTGDGTDTVDITCLKLSYSTRELVEARVLSTDYKLIVAASGLSVTPAIDNYVVLGSDTFIVVGVKSYEINTTVVAYVLQIRNVQPAGESSVNDI